MGKNCIGRIESASKKELLSTKAHHQLAAFAVGMRGPDADPFEIVTMAMERISACGYDCDACGQCHVCRSCRCELIDYDGNVIDLNTRELDDDFGECHLPTWRRFDEVYQNGAVKPQTRSLRRLMWLDLARKIVRRSLQIR